MNSNLAIVIPAYKADYLEQTLHSISLQTNKNFVVYIGDDNSPYNLFSIVNKFLNKFEIVYKKFDENLGSISLVKQWDRCINLIKDERWIWLFSDDDLMDKECVNAFYGTLTNNSYPYDLYRFDTNMIDASNNILHQNPCFDPVLSSYQFVNKKLKGEIRSYVCEYIFSREIYYKSKGFVEFPLAWASDDATWVKFGFDKGIRTIEKAKVSWRLSDTNISNSANKHGNEKCIALILYSKWLLNFFRKKYELTETKKNLKLFFFDQLGYYTINFSPKFLIYLFKNLKSVFNVSHIQLLIFLLKNKILS